MNTTHHLLLLCLSALFSLSACSVILFQSSPTDVKAGLTSAFTLRCSLNDTAASTGIIGRRDVTSTQDNVEQVSSVVIMQNGVDLASVTQTHQAKPLISHNNIRVNGDVTRRPGEKGYMEVTFTSPTQNETGEFVCEVNAITEAGHGVVFSTSVEVTMSQPTMSDLISHIRALELSRDSLAARVKQLEAGQGGHTHSESGVLECFDSTKWTGQHKVAAGYTHTLDVTHKFSQAYNVTPTVQLGVVQMDDDNHKNSRYVVTLVSVDTTGFTIRCGTWMDSTIFRMAVSWVSIDK